MKSLDGKNPKQTPVRPLRNDFTNYTLSRARVAKKRAARWKRPLTSTPSFVPRKESLIMKFIHKPILAVMAILILVGATGTAYAAVNGGLSSITALFSGAKRLKDARIVAVEVKNCHDVNPFNIVSGTGDGHATRYYKVQDRAKMSDEQVVSIVQSICRASYYPGADQKIWTSTGNLPGNKDAQGNTTLVGNAEGTIAALDNQSISIRVSGDVTSTRQPYIEHIRMSPNLIVLDGSGVQKTVKDLKVGDVIYSQYRAIGDALTKSETLPMDKVDWGQQVLVIAYKQTPDQALYDRYEKLSGAKAIEQVAPCKKTISGYCTFDPSRK